MRYSLHLSTRCNLSCTYCYENKERELGIYDLSDDAMKEAFTYIPKDSSLELLGGEPFILLDKLITATEMALDKGIEDIIVTTNGTINNTEVRKYITKYKPKLVVSIDPPRSAPKFRRGIDIGQVLENAAEWDQLTRVIINSSIHPDNLSEMETAFYIFTRAYGFKSIHFGAVEEWMNKDPNNWHKYVEQGTRIINNLSKKELETLSIQPWEELYFFDKEYIMDKGHEVLEIYHVAEENRRRTNFETARSILNEILVAKKEAAGLCELSLVPKVSILTTGA